MKGEEIYEKTLIELGKFKFSRNSMGYEYLVEAIVIVSQDKQTIKDFSTYVYSKIGRKYDVKAQNVQWCITKIINLMYLNTEKSVIENYFHLFYHERPSTKAFIIGVARNVVKKGQEIYY